jgi:hypothetical protein
MTYGFTCPFCKATIDWDDIDGDLQAAAVRAADAGWKIGHLDGQGMYECPDCDQVWDAKPIAARHEREEYERTTVRQNLGRPCYSADEPPPPMAFPPPLSP